MTLVKKGWKNLLFLDLLGGKTVATAKKTCRNYKKPTNLSHGFFGKSVTEGKHLIFYFTLDSSMPCIPSGCRS